MSRATFGKVNTCNVIFFEENAGITRSSRISYGVFICTCTRFAVFFISQLLMPTTFNQTNSSYWKNDKYKNLRQKIKSPFARNRNTLF